MFVAMARGRRAVLFRTVGWLIGLGFVAYLIHRVGPGEVWTALSGVRWRLSWLAATYLAAQTVMALPWGLLLPADARPGTGDVVRSRLAASGLNALLPLVGAGEAVRLLWLRRAAWSDGAAALVADRVMFALASALWVVAGAAAAVHAPGVGPRLVPAVLTAAVALASIAVAVIILARLGRTLSFVHRLGMRLFKRAGDLSPDQQQTAARAEEIDRALRRLFHAPGKLLIALGIHLVGRFLMTLEIYLALRALSVPAGPAQVMVLAAVPVALGFVGAAIPSQMGLAEGALAGVTAALGLGSHAGLALVLLQRARQLLFVPVTMMLLHRRRAPPADAGRTATASV
jgi:uncharacterized protein (TIRG00374 family)